MLLVSIHKRWLLGIFVVGVSALLGNRTLAQITPDRTLPNNSIVMPNGRIFNITGGTQAGANLFHSFKEFSVPTGGEAFFNNAFDIRNIIIRVTGGSPSHIDGIIHSLGTANLFFLNPTGIVFGPNASLNVGGSFVASTASALQFGTQGFFSATNPDASAPLLTINPSALFFNQPTIGAISNSSVAKVGQDPFTGADVTGLKVPDGQSLLLLGGKIIMDGGGLKAFSGRVELGAIAGTGKVDLNVVDNQFHLGIPDSIPRDDISLTNGASVDVTGNGRGSVGVTGRNLEILGGSTVSAGIGLSSMPDNPQPGDITLNATGSVTINYPSTVTNNVMVTIEGTQDTKTGDAGDINITAGDIFIDNVDHRPNTRTEDSDLPPAIPAALQAQSGGEGRAGNVSLSATGSINLIGQDVQNNDTVISTFFLTSQVPGGGDITLKANDSISLRNARLISSRGNGTGNISLFGKESVSITEDSSLSAGTVSGDAGNITIKSNGRVSIDRSILLDDVGKEDAGGGIAGNGGQTNISGRSISITSGSIVESSAEREGMNSGNISLFATDRIEISGYDPFYNPECCSGNRNRPFVYTTLRTSSLLGSLGRAGDINVNTPTLRISDGAIVRADSQNNLNSGNINVNANIVELINGGQLFTSALSTGNAGNINLKNTQRIVIDGTNPTFEKFNEIAQTFVPIADESAKYQLGTTSPLSGIFANTTSSLGGNITIDAPNLLLLRRNAQISARAQNNGNGGNITINAPNGFIVALPSENSKILANANQGSGGQITINAIGIYGLENRTKLPQDPTISEINASSQFGENGNVRINTPDIDPTRGLVSLPKGINTTPHIASNCAAFSDEGGSKFIVTGRGGLPPSPYDPLSSDVTWTDNRLPNLIAQQQPREKPKAKPPSKVEVVEINPATGWVFHGNGEVTLISQNKSANGLQSTPTTCQTAGSHSHP